MADKYKSCTRPARPFALATSIAALLAMAALPSTSPAAVWDDQGGTTNFSEALNWVGNTVPVNGDFLQFNTHPIFVGVNEIVFHDLATLTTVSSISFTADQFTLNATGANSLILTGGITNVSGVSQTVNIPLTLGGTIGVNSTNGNLTIGGPINTNGFGLIVTGNFSSDISGTISGNGGVTLNGTSVLTLSGTNTYSGGTNLISGNVVIDNGAALGTGTLTFSGGGLIADGTFTQTSTSTTINAGTSLIAAVTGEVLTLDTSALTINAGANLVFGSLAGGDGTVVVGDFSGTFTIDPTATITVAAGTLRAGAFLEVITDTVASTTVNAGATLDLNGEGGDIRNLQGAGAVTLGTNAASTLIIQSGSFQGGITGTGNVSKSQPGVLTISGPNGRINTIGTVRINEGELALNGGNVFSTLSATEVIIGSNNVGAPSALLRLLTNSQISDIQAVTVNASGTLNTNGYFERIGALTINDGEVELEGAGGGQAFVIDGLLTMNGGSISGNIGFNEVTLLGDVVATSTAVGAAQIDSRVSLNGDRTFTVNDGPSTFDLQITRVVEDGSGPSRLIKTGAGGLLLTSTANTYSGGTEINGGILAINDNGGLGTGNVSFSGNSELRVVGGPTTLNKIFTVQDGVTGRFSNSTGTDATLTGFITLNTGADLAFGSAGATGVIVLDAVGGAINNGHDFSVDFGTVRNGAGGELDFYTTFAETTTVAAGATLDTFGSDTTISNLQGGGTVTNTSGGLATYTIRSGNFSGALTQSGAGQTALRKNSTGTLTLSGANTFTGATTIDAGRLITQNASALGGAAAPIAMNDGVLEIQGQLNGGTFTWTGGQVGLNPESNDLLTVTQFDNANVTTKVYEIDTVGIELQTYVLTQFTGQTGFTSNSFAAVAKDGSSTIQGTFLLTANQVQLTITGVIVTGPVIQNSAPVNTPEVADFIVNGQVQTGGPTESNTVRSLTFTPNSSLNIFNTLNVTGRPVELVPNSSINLGTSPLGNATLNASQLSVVFGSALTGNGTITGNLINSGLVSPGNSPGTIFVGGNYKQTDTGTLRIEVGGTSETEHDRLIVGGSAELDGTLQLVRINKFKLKRGDKIEFLIAHGGVDGEFARVDSTFFSDTILEPTVVYNEHSVSLELIRGSFEKLGERLDLTPNQRSTARALDTLSDDDDNHEVLLHLDERSLDKLPGDFDRIAPEELSSIFTISTALSQVQGTNLQRRTDDIRRGSSGFSASGLAMQGTGPGYSGAVDFRTGAAGPTGKEIKEVKEVIPEEERRWGAFLTGVGEWVDVSGDGNARGYDITTGGFTLGLDYKVTDHFAIGINAGYAGTSTDLVNDGAVWVNGGKLGLYATYFTGGFYLDTAVTGGYNSYDTKRSALQGAARGSTEGGELNVLVGTGYDWKIGGLQIGPTATFNYTLTGMDGFTEHGSLAPLNIGSRNAESIRSAFGLKASYDWQLGGVVIRPEVRAAWQHEYGDKSYDISASFANGAGDGFLVNGPEIGRDSLLLGAGFAIQLSETCTTYFYYDGELGRDQYDRHSVSGGVRVAF